MGELSVSQVVRVPLILCGAMLGLSVISAMLSGVDGRWLFLDYTFKGAMVTLISVLAYMFIEIWKMARVRTDQPLRKISAMLPARLELIVLPTFVFPIFLAGFTTAKMGMPHIVGFGWDEFWADADAMVFGADPWRWTHGALGEFATNAWAWLYTFAWGAILAYTKCFVAIYGERRFVAIFYTAMMATWLIGGCVIAYLMPAAGPVFAHLFDPQLGERFSALRDSLQVLLPADNAVRVTQGFLERNVDQMIAARGAGISAMPSMHLGACSIYVMAARGTRWMVPALIFWILIFVGSVHFGYHYAFDGIVAAAIAWSTWTAAERLFVPREQSSARLRDRVPAFAAALSRR